jgi:hypothetical protein
MGRDRALQGWSPNPVGRRRGTGIVRVMTCRRPTGLSTSCSPPPSRSAAYRRNQRSAEMSKLQLVTGV